MVGVRDWETTASGVQKCDVLEVYGDSDIAAIRQAHGGELRSLESAAQAARPGADGSSSEPTTARHAGPDVVFTEEPQADETVIHSARMAVEQAGTFGAAAADTGSDIDLDEI